MKDYQFLGTADYRYYGDSNDIKFDSLMDIKTLEGADRKRQDVVKILLTEVGAAISDESYGTRIVSSIFAPLTSSEDKKRLADSVVYALTFLGSIEQSSLDSENIAQILSLKVVPSSDPRYMSMNLTVQLMDGSYVTASIGGIPS